MGASFASRWVTGISLKEEAQKIQAFYKETFNPYLNFHRLCGFATETVDEKGKIKKKYETYPCVIG